jgi:hypothetical protein
MRVHADERHWPFDVAQTHCGELTEEGGVDKRDAAHVDLYGPSVGYCCERRSELGFAGDIVLAGQLDAMLKACFLAHTPQLTRKRLDAPKNGE